MIENPNLLWLLVCFASFTIGIAARVEVKATTKSKLALLTWSALNAIIVGILYAAGSYILSKF